MDRKTARDYLRDKRGPTQRRDARPARTWRTRPDPLKEIWPPAEPFLAVTPELEAKVLVEHLLAGLPEEERAEASRGLRTFQRRVEEWRRHHGPPKEVFFPQATRPGEWMQVDWTHADELGVTIQGAPFDHLLCHAVLCYSNVQHATPCRSEPMLSLRAGLPSSASAARRWDCAPTKARPRPTNSNAARPRAASIRIISRSAGTTD